MTEDRLPPLTPDVLDDAQRALYERITGGPRGSAPQGAGSLVEADGRLAGPFGPMLLDPPIGDALQELGAALRYRGVLPASARELVICCVAAHHGSEFEWRVHAPLARDAGVAEDDLDRVRTGGSPTGGSAADREAARAALALMTHGDLEDDEFQAARAAIGEAGIFEVTALVGYYTTLSLQLRLFRRDARDTEGHGRRHDM